jgi:hypothetical protein
MKRREFIKYSALLIGVSSFAYQPSSYALYPKGTLHVRILQEPYQTISLVLSDLFPPHIAMPSPHSYNVIGFLEAVLQDKRVTQKSKATLKDGVTWLNQSAQNSYAKKYIELPYIQREKLLKQISQKEWGDSWLWTLMNFSFEAMFSDPVYGANTNQIGWKWLGYESGFPRPPRVNRYV